MDGNIMPTSQFEQLPVIIKAIGDIKPTRILDVGCGFGKYGFCAREILETWKHIEPQIDAIEGFEPYIGELQRLVYNKILIMDAIEGLKLCDDKSYDLVLAIDILEHFTKEGGYVFLRELKRVGKTVIISTPKLVLDQGPLFENNYEIHKTQWNKNEIVGKLDTYKQLKDRGNLILVIGREAEKIQKHPEDTLKFKLTRIGMKCKRKIVGWK
jgi:hypothetical protein